MSKDEFPPLVTPDMILSEMFQFMEDWKYKLHDMLTSNIGSIEQINNNRSCSSFNETKSNQNEDDMDKKKKSNKIEKLWSKNYPHSDSRKKYVGQNQLPFVNPPASPMHHQPITNNQNFNNNFKNAKH